MTDACPIQVTCCTHQVICCTTNEDISGKVSRLQKKNLLQITAILSSAILLTCYPFRFH